MKKQIVIITGCSGRIATHLIAKLSPEQFHIVGLDVVAPQHTAENFQFIHADLTSDSSIRDAFHTIQHTYGNTIASIVHLAAYYNFTGGAWSKYQSITIDGTRRMLQAAHGLHTEQFLFSSSMLVHKPCALGERITESWPREASWEYPRSKILTEDLLIESHGHIPLVIMRIAGCYDDECHSIPLSNQIQRIYEKQLTARLYPGNVLHGSTYLHLDDLASAIHSAITRRAQLPHQLTLLIGEETTASYQSLQYAISTRLYSHTMKTYRVPKWFAKFGAYCLNLLGQSFIKPWMIDIADANYNIDISSAVKHLGWKPRHTVIDSLRPMLQLLIAEPKRFYQLNDLKAPRKFPTPNPFTSRCSK